jgi:caffeoyl-CoA O-methyltransferase
LGDDDTVIGMSESLEKRPLAESDSERQILAVLEAMPHGMDFSSVSPTDGRFLRQMTEAIGATCVVELGTSNGYSGIWFGLALRRTGGHLWTHESDPARAALARTNYRQAGVDHLISIVEGDAHETVLQHSAPNARPIDLVFLDADKPGYPDYLEKLLPLVRPGGLILAHNMREPAPDTRYIAAITTDPRLETTFVFMDGGGLGVTLKKRES